MNILKVIKFVFNISRKPEGVSYILNKTLYEQRVTHILPNLQADSVDNHCSRFFSQNTAQTQFNRTKRLPNFFPTADIFKEFQVISLLVN